MKTQSNSTVSVSDPYRTDLHRIIVFHRGFGYHSDSPKPPVMLEVNLQGKRIRFNTGVNIPPDAWDPGNLLIKKNYPGSKDLNLIIQNCRSRISDIFVRYRLQLREVTPDILRNEYQRPSVSIDFLDWMAQAIAERKGEITGSSIRQHRAHLNKLKEYRPSILFSELTEDFFVEYQRWLKREKENCQNTRYNSLKTIRTYLNVAKRRGLISANPLRQMPVKRAQSERGFLMEDELQRLVELYKKGKLSENYQRALRHYLFSCFTGIRISDIQRIRMDDVLAKTLILMPYKTKNVNAITVKIPLCKMALQLIQDETPYRVDGLIFNTYSEQKEREYVRDVIKHAGINRPLTFHSSRHTFATIFLRKTKNLAALQKLLGHTKIEQTMVYAHILTDDIASEIQSLDEFYIK